MNDDDKRTALTQNEEVRASCERTQETLALLELAALGQADLAAGRTTSADVVIDRLRARRYDDEQAMTV